MKNLMVLFQAQSMIQRKPRDPGMGAPALCSLAKASFAL
jgi:hypothetical protein